MKRYRVSISAIFTLATFLCLLDQTELSAAERPNIVWITSEDNASHWMGCYGNEQAKTPNIDSIARKGVVFDRAYSNAPVCAVARCTLLHGAYSVTLGTQHMRSRHPIPNSFKPYVSYLREQGYFCTNNYKTDYNREGSDKDIWDRCGRKAHYRDRAADQPFFSIFNFTVCHESSLFPEKIANNRKQNVIPQQTRLQPDEINLPPYLPDLPEMRSDFAIYHDNLTAMDNLVGDVLRELEKRGLREDTIVFYYSDHGGPTPRGKRYLQDTGVRIPMVVHFPDKWKHLCPFGAGTRTSEPVAFVDLAPTLLSLVNLKTPSHMQGRAFLGKHRTQPTDDYVFLFGDRFDELVGMRRGITDGRFKYIRRFMPHLPAAPYSYYQFSMPSWQAWQAAWKNGELKGQHAAIWEHPQPKEMLYDLQADPWETRNIATDPAYQEKLTKYRAVLREKMSEFRDTAVVPESMFDSRTAKTVYEEVQAKSFPYEEILASAMLASSPEATPFQVRELLANENDAIKYWGTIGCMALGPAANDSTDDLKTLLDHKSPTIRISTAVALSIIGEKDAAAEALVEELQTELTPEEAILLCNSFRFLQCGDHVPSDWIEANLDNENEYVKRFATRLADQKTLQPN